MKDKKLLVVGVILGIIITNVLFISVNYFYKNTPEVSAESIDYSTSNLISIYVEDEDGNYVVTDSTIFDQGSDYVYNEEKSYCTNESDLSYDSTTSKISVTSSGTDNCYVYFDAVNYITMYDLLEEEIVYYQIEDNTWKLVEDFDFDLYFEEGTVLLITNDIYLNGNNRSINNLVLKIECDDCDFYMKELTVSSAVISLNGNSNNYFENVLIDENLLYVNDNSYLELTSNNIINSILSISNNSSVLIYEKNISYSKININDESSLGIDSLTILEETDIYVSDTALYYVIQ